MPRSGSNHLMNVLSGYENHKAHSEVFARDFAYTMDGGELDMLEAMTGCILPRDKFGQIDPKAPTTTQLIYDEPFATIEALARTRQSHQTSVSLKLFGYHLPRGVTKVIFKELDPTVMVLTRRLIDAYISKLKAQQLQRWVWADTTYVKPTADIRDFQYWHQRNKGWYEHVSECTGGAHWELEYDDLAVPQEELVGHLRSAVPYGLGDWSAERCRLRPLTKQDRNEEPGDKIANWETFASELEAAGLYDVAMGHF